MANEMRAEQDGIYRAATEIAIKVCGGRPQHCWGWKAKIFNAAWDAACIALGGDLADYRIPLPLTQNSPSR